MENFETHVDKVTDHFILWMGRDLRNRHWVYEITLRVKGGVRHVINRLARRPAEARCVRFACQYGVFSRRPYQPGQACDGSITTVALTLYYTLCEALQIDSLALLRRAYPDEEWTERDRAVTCERGLWEGIATPLIWDAAAIEGVLDSLTAINYHSLNSVLSEQVDAIRGSAAA